jgi:hypothetical protein
MKSPLRRLIIALTIITVVLCCLVSEYMRVNKPLVDDLIARWQDRNAGPRKAGSTQLVELGKLVPIKTLRLQIDDANDCLKNNHIDSDELRKQIAGALGAKIGDTADDTACDAPKIDLAVLEKSAAPFTFRRLVLTKLTLTSPRSSKNENGAILYSDEHSDIYTGTDGRPVQAAIDRAISRLQSTIALISTPQRPIEHMYEAPQKTIDGRRGPTRSVNDKEPDR